MKNQTAAYQTILEKRDTLILELDEKIEKLQESNRILQQPQMLVLTFRNFSIAHTGRVATSPCIFLMRK